jgi:hypothetical protein
VNEILETKRIEINKKFEFFNDPKFIFEEDKHVYTYDGVKFDSVTTFIKIFKKPFDLDFWSKKKAYERNVDVSVVLDEWEEKGNVANILGTAVHAFIEDFLSGRNPDIPIEDGKSQYAFRVNNFLKFYERKLKQLVPLKSELKVFSRKWRLAGTIDQPFLFWDNERQKILFLIGDWKTNGVFKSDLHKKGKYTKLLRPFSNLWENHLNEYSIQISLYRLILEEELGIATDGGFLCHIGPDTEVKMYPVLDLREPLKAYLDQNRCDNFDIYDLN